MKEFIDKNNLMFSSQYAFCKSHSTEHAILDIVEAILSNMDKPYFSCGVFIDLIQSIIKLNFYGFRGLINDWFQSYLKNRMQTIQIGEYLSTYFSLWCAPGTGPRTSSIFFFYINNIHLSSKSFSEVKNLAIGLLIICQKEEILVIFRKNRLTLLSQLSFVLFSRRFKLFLRNM